MATAIGYSVPRRRAARSAPRRPATRSAARLAGVGCALAGAALLSIGHHSPSIVGMQTTPSAEPISPPAAATPLEQSTLILSAGIRDAEEALAASEGKVLDSAVREELAALATTAQAAVDEGRMLSALAAPGALEGSGDGSAPLVGQLESGVGAVTTAVAAWEAEQARIAAEREAARLEAARLAAEAAARAPARVRAAGTTAVVAFGPHVEGIWTSGGQGEIDACRGSVNVPPVAGYLGASFYAAEHWSCGGRAWSGIGVGAQVAFPGYGLYEVAGRVGGLSYGADASAVPSGYDGYYQTCINGASNNMHVWLLTRIG